MFVKNFSSLNHSEKSLITTLQQNKSLITCLPACPTTTHQHTGSRFISLSVCTRKAWPKVTKEYEPSVVLQ